MKQPQRTCVGCHEVRPKKELIRIVRTPEGRVAVDPTGKMNGRGAYIDLSEECLERALKKGRLASALETIIDEGTAETIRVELATLIEKRSTAQRG